MTREQAIEIVKTQYPHDHVMKTALGMLIPELRESEDEKMMNQLHSWMKEFGGAEEYTERVFQWLKCLLEKQKELDKMIVVSPEVWDNAISDAFENGKKEGEKQKEPKPAHTAKEMWKEMRLEVYAQASGNRHEPNYSDESTKMFSLCDIDEIFEKIGDSTVKQKPAEWSEEDEVKLNQCIRIVTGWEADYDIVKSHYSNFLKSLRPDTFQNGNSRPKTSENWKPSEEQMRALADTLEDIPEHYKPKCTLETLERDLKKL